MTIFGRTISRLTIGVIGIILIIGLIAFGTSQCQMRRNAASQARVDAGQATAGATTGEVSLNTLEGVVANDTATEAAVSNGVAATRASPEAGRDAAGISALCQFKAAKNKPECKK